VLHGGVEAILDLAALAEVDADSVPQIHLQFPPKC
jgi:hypothetical protein